MTNIEFIVYVDSKYYEISEIVTSISYTDKLNDGCSKLEFSFVNNGFEIKNGSIVQFKYDGTSIFKGFVFKWSGAKKGKEIQVTAYDQLRYCKAKDEIVILNDTATTLVKRMCTYFNLRTGTLANTNYVLAEAVKDGKTWLDILYDGIGETLQNTGKKYCLRDEFGKIALRDIEDLKLNLILGDESLCYDFDYKSSIDDEFYNRIKFYIKGKDDATVGKFINAQSDTSIKKYGLLQYFESMDKDTTTAQAKAKARALLRLYNQEVETLTLECIGDTRIRAGHSFYAYISDIKLNKRLFVKSVTHKYLPNYTMSLEMAI